MGIYQASFRGTRKFIRLMQFFVVYGDVVLMLLDQISLLWERELTAWLIFLCPFEDSHLHDVPLGDERYCGLP